MSVKRVEGYVASDQTGKFPIISNKGMLYICVFYIYDPNYITGIALKSSKKRSYCENIKKCDLIINRGCKPRLHKMDNETSKKVEDFIESQNTQHHYTPPNCHRTNPAIRALQT